MSMPTCAISRPNGSAFFSGVAAKNDFTPRNRAFFSCKYDHVFRAWITPYLVGTGEVGPGVAVVLVFSFFPSRVAVWAVWGCGVGVLARPLEPGVLKRRVQKKGKQKQEC